MPRVLVLLILRTPTLPSIPVEDSEYILAVGTELAFVPPTGTVLQVVGAIIGTCSPVQAIQEQRSLGVRWGRLEDLQALT
jgi:hypothetical protein